MPETLSRPVSAAAVGVAGMLSLAAAMGVGRFAFTPMLPLMIHEGHLDVAAGGWLAAANYLGYLLGALTAGRLQWPARRLALLALSLTALLTAAMALPLGAWAWAGLRLAAGVASAWAFVATSIWCLQALAERSETGSGVNVWSSALYAGVGGGIALAGLACLVGAIRGQTPSMLWTLLGLLATLLMLPAWWVTGRLPESMPSPAHARASPSRAQGITGLIAAYGLFGFGYILPATFLPVLARDAVSDPRLFGLAWPVFGFTAAVSTLVVAWWLRHASRLRVWAISHALMGLGALLPSLFLAGWSIALSALLVGGTFMVATLAGMQEVRTRAGAQAGAALARMTAAFALGQIAGPVVSSLLTRLALVGQAGALGFALQLGAAGLLASAWWLWRKA